MYTNNWHYWFNLESEPKLLPNLHRQTVYLFTEISISNTIACHHWQVVDRESSSKDDLVFVATWQLWFGHKESSWGTEIHEMCAS